MAWDEIVAYIAKKRAEGKSEQEIYDSLIQAGWSSDDVKKAVFVSSHPDVPLPPVHEEKPAVGDMIQKTAPKTYHNMWDAFEHILMFISMYVMATALAIALHHFVDKWFPGIDKYGYSSYESDYQNTVVLGAMAALIVSFPVFSFLFLRITQRTQLHPQVRTLKARRFLIYLTLVATFLIILGYIISFVYSFLRGNITLNFILHILVTVVISGIIFTYYLSQVKEDRQLHE